MWGTIFPQTARVAIIHVMSSNMHSRHASFTFVLTITCFSVCSFVHGSSDVIECLSSSGGVKVTKHECLKKQLRKIEMERKEENNSTYISKDTDGALIIRAASGGNNTVDVTFSVARDNSELSERKMKMKMSTSNILALLFIPAMWIAGMMPWILPGVKMAVMMVTMMNNMAFSTALFSLIRGYLFDTRPDDHVVYLNYGYKNGQQGHGDNNVINYKNNPYLYAHKPVAG